ncbi:MAG: hypothetical protein AAB263_15005, partial [Planctomycetota bacterium]
MAPGAGKKAQESVGKDSALASSHSSMRSSTLAARITTSRAGSCEDVTRRRQPGDAADFSAAELAEGVLL